MKSWDTIFLNLLDLCVKKYREGNQDYTTYYQADDVAFLASIGYKPRELFDFVEDFCDQQVPALSTALLVAAVRRDYFLVEQKGILSKVEITVDDLPSFGETLGGLAYLPRILKKAQAKLRGELDPDIMYGCGGDRRFLANHGNIHLADFLRLVWACGDDDAKLVDQIKNQMKV